jgi:acyl-CoA synthetase (NDP forming)
MAVVADGGGHGALAAGLLERAGLGVAALSEPVREGIAALLPPAAAAGNPVDLAGGGERDIRTFARVVAALAASGEVDGVLLSGFFGGYGSYGEAVATAEVEVAYELARAAAADGIPLVVHSLHPDSPAAGALRAGGVPVHREVERSVRALRALADAQAPPRGVPGAHGVAAGVAESGAAGVDPAAGGVAAGVDPAAGGATGYGAARALFAGAGVPLVGGEIVGGGDVPAAAERVGYPVVLKALGSLHKSDAGGVALGLAGADALAEALADMTARLAPPAFAVERMAPGGIELIAGVRRDPRFGPLVLAGAGGVHAEVLRDTAVALAPVDDAGAEALLRSLRIAPLLLGARGRPPLDLAAAARAVAALSRLAAARPDLAELEANPLLVMREGCVALDARVVPERTTGA